MSRATTQSANFVESPRQQDRWTTDGTGNKEKEPGKTKAKVLYNQMNGSTTHCSHMCVSSQEAKKKDEKLLKFPEKLQDVQSAAR